MFFNFTQRVTHLPHVTFHKGVYWLIFYTILAVVMVNMQSDCYNSFNQGHYLKHTLKLPPSSEVVTTVAELWTFITGVLLPGLLDLKTYTNITVSGDPADKIYLNPGNPHSMGSMVIPPANVDRDRSCNFEFSTETEDKRDYMSSWSGNAYSKCESLSFLRRIRNILFIFAHPLRRQLTSLAWADLYIAVVRYWTVMHFDNKETPYRLGVMQRSDWIDQHTRYLLIDFCLINPGASIVSAFRITVDFKRPAPFWHTEDFHFRFKETSNHVYILITIGFFFIIISIYNLIKEILAGMLMIAMMEMMPTSTMVSTMMTILMMCNDDNDYVDVDAAVHDNDDDDDDVYDVDVDENDYDDADVDDNDDDYDDDDVDDNVDKDDDDDDDCEDQDDYVSDHDDAFIVYDGAAYPSPFVRQ
ncbi:hypothetical protein ElyMa_000122700 [Elysia marginata]|uniref:Polycystin domain-containing protein n=1 Tax=Elysia marginata TaxID=1093978 RepID=A0AAV4EM86_9GAST|nr:hypothetical protein ElyMa_000122700 [Elysia marginata]